MKKQVDASSYTTARGTTLDCYIQTQTKLCAASDPKDIALWSEVWTYVQTREGAGWNDRLFVVIEPDEACAEASLLCPVSAVPAPLSFRLRTGFSASSADALALVSAQNVLTGDS